MTGTESAEAPGSPGASCASLCVQEDVDPGCVILLPVLRLSSVLGERLRRRDRAVMDPGEMPACALPDRDCRHAEPSVGWHLRVGGRLREPADRDCEVLVSVGSNLDLVPFKRLDLER